MGQAKRRGTFQERKAYAKGSLVPAAPSRAHGLLGATEIRQVEAGDGTTKVWQRFRQQPGLYRTNDGRFYRYDGKSVRRATAEEIQAAEARTNG